MERFVFLTDLHWGYERRNRHRVPLHDLKAISTAMKFVADFAPDHIILGGDVLDSGCISHHNHGKPGAVEGFRLLADAKELREKVIAPLEALKTKSLTFIEGNHEKWIADLVEKVPALEGIVDVEAILGLKPKWKFIPNGEAHRLGKLVFVHGDQLSGGENAAKAAVIAYEKNVRFGHLHTFAAYTKVSTVEAHGHTAISVPCLCRKGPKYGGGSPNRWSQGFLYGYIDGGQFHDAVAIIIDGKTVINGKLYKG